ASRRVGAYVEWFGVGPVSGTLTRVWMFKLQNFWSELKHGSAPPRFRCASFRAQHGFIVVVMHHMTRTVSLHVVPAAFALLGAYVALMPPAAVGAKVMKGPTETERPTLNIRAVAELVTPALATAKTDYVRALLLRSQIHRSADPASGIATATNEDLADATTAYRLSVLESARSNSCNGKAILFI